MTSILIAEDDEPKLMRLSEFLSETFAQFLVDSRRSVTTTLAALRLRLPDLMFLDMSLPTFEVGPGEQGGRPQDFGGLAVMDFMEFEDLICPVIIVTQYETFAVSKGGSMSLEEVAAKARRDHPEIFRGLVYYNSVTSNWKSELEYAVRLALPGMGEV